MYLGVGANIFIVLVKIVSLLQITYSHMRLVLLPLGEIICTDLLDDVFNQVVIHLSKCFKFNFVYLSSISSPFLDKFGGGFCQPHLVSTSKSMLIQKFMYIVNLCGPETELALRFGVDTLVIGVPLVAVG